MKRVGTLYLQLDDLIKADKVVDLEDVLVREQLRTEREREKRMSNGAAALGWCGWKQPHREGGNKMRIYQRLDLAKSGDLLLGLGLAALRLGLDRRNAFPASAPERNGLCQRMPAREN